MTIKTAINLTSKALDIWLPHKILYVESPGLAVGIFHKNKMLYQKSFGYSDLKSRKKMKSDDLFRIASISKMFTAVSLLQLQEKKKLRLNDKVSKFLPWFKGKNKVGDLNRVTIREILSHRSGIFRDGEKPYWATHKFPQSLSNTISTRSIIFKNSKQFKYSNHGYAILGEVIKAASGLSYEKYIQKNILDILNLKSTYPDLTSAAKTKLAKGYRRIIPGKKKREVFPNIYTYKYAPATGFISNVPDLALFLASLSLNSSGPQILSEKSKKEMMKEISSTVDKDKYGLGMDVIKISKNKFVEHSGGFAGYITFSCVNPKSGLGAIVLANSLTVPSVAICLGILEMFYYFLNQKGSEKKSHDHYSGVYRNDWGDTAVVDSGNSLMTFGPAANYPTNNKTILKSVQKHKFRIETKNVFNSLGEIAAFTSFKKGKAQKLIWGEHPLRKI